VFILQVLKVLCFDTDLQVFILKVVRRFIFQAAGPPTGTVNAELGRRFARKTKGERLTWFVIRGW